MTCYRQIWVGGVDFVSVLSSIGSWWVGCEYDQESREAVLKAERMGLVGRRTHYAPATPEGVEAYELTDAGLDYVVAHRGPKDGAYAAAMRQWYRDRAKTPPIPVAAPA
jgi:hypothetical protein